MSDPKHAILTDGSVAAEADISLGGHQIKDVLPATDGTDALTKTQGETIAQVEADQARDEAVVLADTAADAGDAATLATAQTFATGAASAAEAAAEIASAGDATSKANAALVAAKAYADGLLAALRYPMIFYGALTGVALGLVTRFFANDTIGSAVAIAWPIGARTAKRLLMNVPVNPLLGATTFTIMRGAAPTGLTLTPTQPARRA